MKYKRQENRIYLKKGKRWVMFGNHATKKHAIRQFQDLTEKED